MIQFLVNTLNMVLSEPHVYSKDVLDAVMAEA